MRHLNEIIAENLTELRKTNNLTQTELAEKICYSDKSISKWENGLSMPSIDILVALAELYGVSVDYIISDSTIEERKKYECMKKGNRGNKVVIAMLGILIVWLMACIVYIYCVIYKPKSSGIINPWIVFVYAVPLSSILMIVFNGIWGKRKYNFCLCSILVWSILASIFLTCIPYANVWLIFILGIPLQIGIILWSQLK